MKYDTMHLGKWTEGSRSKIPTLSERKHLLPTANPRPLWSPPMPSQTPFAFASRFQLSTADFQPFRTNSFRLIQFRKNASVSPLVSHSFKTKDLKPFRFTHFQKKGGWWVPLSTIQT